MPHVTANGIRQHYATMGPHDDPDVPLAVLIHGMLIDSLASYYFTIGKPLADAGVSTLMYDLRGHGKTDKPPTGYAVSGFAADLIALLDELDITRPVFLIGNSFGGSLAIYLAARYPERVAGVVMVDAEAPTVDWGVKIAGMLIEARAQLTRPEVIPFIRVRHGRHMAKQAKAALGMLNSTPVEAEMPSGSMLSVEEVQSISCPVLAIYAGDWHVKDDAPRLSSWIAECTTTVIDGQDHSILVSVPDKVCALVLPWISSHVAAARKPQ